MVHGFYGLDRFLDGSPVHGMFFFVFSEEGYSGFRMVGIAKGQFMVDLVKYSQQA